MNYSRFTGMLLSLAILVFSVSCNNQSSEETTATDSTTTDTMANTTTAAPASTISTTPQDMVVATHKVKDYDKWKASYDEPRHDSLRLANGMHSYVIGRGLQDPNMVLVALKADDMNKAKSFAKDPSLKKAMQEGGVTGPPSIKFTTMVWQDTAQISTDLRSRTTFMVKDWEKWRSYFDSTRQHRLDNGVQDRAYGHDVDDNHKVTVVVALTDSTKAQAMWKSDDFKKRLAESGVIGQPQRFLYRMVQRY